MSLSGLLLAVFAVTSLATLALVVADGPARPGGSPLATRQSLRPGLAAPGLAKHQDPAGDGRVPLSLARAGWTVLGLVGRLVLLPLKLLGRARADHGPPSETGRVGAPGRDGNGYYQGLPGLLRRAELKFQPHEFVSLAVVAAGAGMVAGLLLGRGFVPGLLGAALAGWLPFGWARQRAAQRLKSFNQQLPDALDIVANALRSGYAFLQALDVVAHELPPPIAREFGQVVKECRVDIPVEDALLNLVERVPGGDLDLVVTAVLVQRQVGGNLSEVLDTINHTIRERMRVQGEIKVLTAQGRLSGVVVALVPVGLAVALHLVNPDFIRPMFQHPLGLALLAVGAAMQVVGFVVIRRMVNIEV